MNKKGESYIEDGLLEDILEYCHLNGLKPVMMINGMLRKAFMEEKWLKPVVEDTSIPEAKKEKNEKPGDDVPPTKPNQKNGDLYGE